MARTLQIGQRTVAFWRGRAGRRELWVLPPGGLGDLDRHFWAASNGCNLNITENLKRTPGVWIALEAQKSENPNKRTELQRMFFVFCCWISSYWCSTSPKWCTRVGDHHQIRLHQSMACPKRTSHGSVWVPNCQQNSTKAWDNSTFLESIWHFLIIHIIPDLFIYAVKRHIKVISSSFI